jgi:hypothetical protein
MIAWRSPQNSILYSCKAGRGGVIELECGTSGGWLWVIFRISDALGGPDASQFRFGLWVDTEAAPTEFLLVPGESLAEAILTGEIEEPQVLPTSSMSIRQSGYSYMSGIYWRSIPEPTRSLPSG